MCFCFFFFFQAEDGIRDYKVTGVQTCALPISIWFSHSSCLGLFSPGYQRNQLAQCDGISKPTRGVLWLEDMRTWHRLERRFHLEPDDLGTALDRVALFAAPSLLRQQIGRASCRERV